MMLMGTRAAEPKRKHPIQVAARRSGLSPDVIRVWERRYGAVHPDRSETNRRLYTDADVEKLLLLGQVTRAGRRIGDVADLSLRELREIVATDRDAAARVGAAASAAPREPSTRRHLAACLDAIAGMDALALENAVARASVDLPPTVLLDRVLFPLMTTVGERWSEGSMRVAHEHMASAVVRSFLGLLKTGASAPESAPEIVVATPAGQRHELGALMASIAAATDGWRVTYLGADLPADEIAAAALAREARAVALSIVYPADDPRLGAELRTLAVRVGDGIALIAGGASAPAYGAVLREIGAGVVSDLPTLRSDLRTLRYAPKPD